MRPQRKLHFTPAEARERINDVAQKIHTMHRLQRDPKTQEDALQICEQIGYEFESFFGVEATYTDTWEKSLTMLNSLISQKAANLSYPEIVESLIKKWNRIAYIKIS